MTNMTKTMLLALATMMATASMASGQETKSLIITNSSGLSLQTKVSTNSAPAKDDLFAGAEKFAQGASEVTEINLDPSTIGIIGRGADSAGRGGALARKMNFLVVHTYKYDKPGMYNMDDFAAYSKKLTDGTWSCSIHVRTKGGSTDICSRLASDNETNEMVILTAEPKELTFIHISGRMSLNELQQLGNASGNIPK
jgi:hypothetical protein